MTNKKTKNPTGSGYAHTTKQEINWLDELTRSKSPADRLAFLLKYMETLDIRNVWKDDYGTNLEKQKLISYCKRRIKALSKGEGL